MSQYLADLVTITTAQVQEAACHPLAVLQIVIAAAPLEVLRLPVVLFWPAAALGHTSLGTGPGYRVGHGGRCERVDEGSLLVELLEDVPLSARLDRAVPAVVAELFLAVGGGQTAGLAKGSRQTRLLATLVVLTPRGRHVSAGSTHLALRSEHRHHRVLRNEVFAGRHKVFEIFHKKR